MLNRIHYFLFVLCSILLLVIQARSANPDFKIVSSSANSLTLQFQTGGWQADTLLSGNTPTIRFSFAEAGFLGKPGEPLLAASGTMLGVPPERQITVQVVSQKSRIIENVSVATHPQPNADAETSAGLTTQFSQPPIASIGETGYFREQRVAQLRVVPMQIMHAQQKVRLFDQLTLRINFTGGKPGEKALRGRSTAAPDEELYAQAILNYEQARDWRETRRAKFQKPAEKLADVKRYKFAVQREGIYKIAGNWLAAKGIDISAIDPATLKIYNNGGRELSQELSAAFSVGLVENAIEVVDGGDGRFDGTDYLLFYAQGVNGVAYNTTQNRFSHYLHTYTRENIYWLAWGGDAGKRIQQQTAVNNPAAQEKTISEQLFYRENEVNNLYNSGTLWYGEHFSTTENQRRISAYLVNAKNGSAAAVRLMLQTLGGIHHRFEVLLNDVIIMDTTHYGERHQLYEIQTNGLLKTGQNIVEINYKIDSNIAEAYLDWLELEYVQTLTAVDNELSFYSPAVESDQLYQISGFTDNEIAVYDVTDFANVKKMEITLSGNGAASFVDSPAAAGLKKYYAIAAGETITPNSLTEDELSDLQNFSAGAAYVIITPEEFYDAAIQLATHRQTFDGLTCKVVKIQDVYDEFSGGVFDPGAIRNFLRHAWSNWEIAPQIVLLFGDGNFDYKNNYQSSLLNWIPPFESDDSSEDYTRAMDEWYAYVSGDDQIIDLAIGRIPAQTSGEAFNYVDKIKKYDTEPVLGKWKNTIILLADDEFGKGGNIVSWNQRHTTDAETIAESYVPQTFDITKIYLIEYPSVPYASVLGIRKPVASEAFITAHNNGALIVNYIGHSNEKVLTDERILELSEVNEKIQNGWRQPFWIASSCEWGRFDMPEAQAMSEMILMMHSDGAIGLLSSTRDANAEPNTQLNRLFLRSIFPYTSDGFQPGATSRVGVALMNAKNDMNSTSGNIINNQKYHILGDPALKIAMPQYRAIIRSIVPDTLKALSLIKVNGFVVKDNARWDDFNGQIYITAFDSRQDKTYTFDGGTIRYKMSGGTIFRGIAPVENGEFESSFFVPKGITYGGSLGRVSGYFWNDETDGAGKRDSLVVGGTSFDFVDYDGPVIQIRFKDQNTGEDAIVGPNPALQITLADSVSGINITGEIGHKIQITIDDDVASRKDITDYFMFDEGSHLCGQIEYPLAAYWQDSSDDDSEPAASLTDGEHKITIKAWDNFNNSGQESIHFTVMRNNDFCLDNLLNYPNPFSDKTTFSFIISHAAEIELQIFTLNGRKLCEWTDFAEAGYNYHLSWDGHDASGEAIANGVYLYRISAQSVSGNSGRKTEKVGKMILMR